LGRVSVAIKTAALRELASASPTATQPILGIIPFIAP